MRLSAPGHSQSPRIRPDLRAFARRDGSVVVEDPSRNKHFRLGSSEYRFVAHLAHSGSVAEAHSAASQSHSDWTPESSRQLLGWLAQRGLLEAPNQATPAASDASSQRNSLQDPLFVRVSFGSPEGWTKSLASLARPLTRPAMGWLVALLLAAASLGLLSRWSEFASAYANLMTPTGAFALVGCAVLLKAVHELGHCVVCHLYGGGVRDWGVLIVCGAPLPYVDVSDSRRFPSGRARIAVALAGVAFEAAAVALAVLLALALDSPAAFYVAAHLVLTCGVASLAFNLNPLMKFDGYYVLADLIGANNLYSDGVHYVRQLGARVIGRGTVGPPASPPTVVKLYGLASLVWRLLAMLLIAGLAIKALHGLGVILVAWTAWRTFGRSLTRDCLGSFTSMANGGPGRASLTNYTRPVVLAALLAACACYFPAPTETTTYATVEFDPPSIIRSPADAFVERVYVEDKQQVRPGDLLLTLRSDTLIDRLGAAETSVRRLQQQVRAAQQQADMHTLKEAQSELDAAQELRGHVAEQVEALQVRALTAGVVSARSLDELIGTYVEEGEQIAAIGRDDAKRLRALVATEAEDEYIVGQEVRYLTSSGESGAAVIEQVLPRATRVVDGSALAAIAGGPLEVIEDASGSLTFCEPYTPIVARLDRVASRATRAGQRVAVSIQARTTLAEWLFRLIWS